MCENCSHRFDDFSDKLDECPECHEKSLRHMFGPGSAFNNIDKLKRTNVWVASVNAEYVGKRGKPGTYFRKS